MDTVAVIAAELNRPASRVAAVLKLLDEGCTVPFIARYRKEATGSMDEEQIRIIRERSEYLAKLADRKAAVLKSIEEQGKLTPELLAKIEAAAGLAEVEDLYLPFKPKRRTRGTIARERGLEPLAALLRKQEGSRPLTELAAPFVDPSKEVPDANAALAGAGDIIAEDLSTSAELRAALRPKVMRSVAVTSGPTKDWVGKSGKFDNYYNYSRAAKDIPGHARLALRRGEAEKVLSVKVRTDAAVAVPVIESGLIHRSGGPFEPLLKAVAADAWDRLLEPSLTGEVWSQLLEEADAEAVRTFSANLRNLLLAAPAGGKTALGIDPGFRTGCKVAVVDRTGKFLETTVIHPTEPRRDIEGATATLLDLIRRFGVELIAIGNGTGGRETDAFVAGVLAKLPEAKRPVRVLVNESGASVYSAGETARAEFPDLDLTVRGAISIARRLQDPLAELVKIEPKSIGVGQYQHDVDQKQLGTALEETVESCVNFVGVDLNTASASLLRFVSGINATLAKNIVEHRDARGAFRRRQDLLKVPRFGPKAFEQAAGFLRIRDGEHPLDNSAVHPERYALVERIAADLGTAVGGLVGSTSVEGIDISKYVEGDAGPETLRDIVAELRRGGRDPRKEFRTAAFADGVNDLKDLKVGMVLEGTVTNVTAFGAFVDVGVHQDGLVHVSELSWRFVKDPAEAVKVGDIVKAKVLSVDLDRKRVALSIKQTQAPPAGSDRPTGAARPPVAAQPKPAAVPAARPAPPPTKPTAPTKPPDRNRRGGLG